MGAYNYYYYEYYVRRIFNCTVCTCNKLLLIFVFTGGEKEEKDETVKVGEETVLTMQSIGYTLHMHVYV